MSGGASWKVRSANGDDAPAIADIHVRSWQAAYRDILPDSMLESLSVSEREQSWSALLGNGDDRWLTLVAEDPGGGLTGFCSVATPSRDEGVGEKTAEIGAIYVDPDKWWNGAGSAMLSTALKERTASHSTAGWAGRADPTCCIRPLMAGTIRPRAGRVGGGDWDLGHV